MFHEYYVIVYCLNYQILHLNNAFFLTCLRLKVGIENQITFSNKIISLLLGKYLVELTH